MNKKIKELLAEEFADRCFDPRHAGEGASYPTVLQAMVDLIERVEEILDRSH